MYQEFTLSYSCVVQKSVCLEMSIMNHIPENVEGRTSKCHDAADAIGILSAAN